MRSALSLLIPVGLHEVCNKGNRFVRRHLTAKYVIFLSDFNIFNKLDDFFTITKYKMIELYAWQSMNIISFVNFDLYVKFTRRMDMHKINEN